MTVAIAMQDNFWIIIRYSRGILSKFRFHKVFRYSSYCILNKHKTQPDHIEIPPYPKWNRYQSKINILISLTSNGRAMSLLLLSIDLIE